MDSDRDLGEEPCEVYAWCLPQDENTGDRWAIKIGWAGSDGFNRRWKKDFASYLPVLPRYLIRIRCETEDQAQDSERLIHKVLKNNGHQIRGIPGAEWFKTNPDEIEHMVNYLGIVKD